MANGITCLRQNCQEQPRVNVTATYPPDRIKPDGHTTRTAFCLDCVGERVQQMLKVGEAISVAVERIE